MRTLLFSCVVSGAILMVTVSVAAAGVVPPDTSQWTCERCPFERETTASLTSGLVAVSGADYPYGDASGYEDGLFLQLDGKLRTRLGNDRLAADVAELGLDARRIRLQVTGPGRYKGELTHAEYPSRVFDTTRTVFLQTSPTQLELPDNWQPAALTSGFSALDSNLADRDIDSDRSMTRFAFTYRVNKPLTVSAALEQQRRDGTEIAGGAYVNQAVQLARAVDQTTSSMEIGAQYALSRGTLSVSFRNEQFKNDAPSLTWDNPFLSQPGANRGQLAGPPDNEVRVIRLAGEFRLRGETRLSVSQSLSRGEQDATFLPYTTNAALVAPLPRASLAGKVDRSSFRLALSGRLSARAGWRVSYRDDRRDNDTPTALYERVIADSFASGDPVTNVPYNYESRHLSGRGNWRVRPGIRLTGGFDARQMERDFQEVAEQDEYGTWGQLSWRVSDSLDMKLKGGSSRREVDRYDESLAVSGGQNPLLRKYNLAHRFRQYGLLRLELAPLEKPLQLSAEAQYSEDDYSRSRLGMLDADDRRVTFGASWALESGLVFADASAERMRSNQSGSQLFGQPDWRARHEDRFTSFSTGISLPEVTEKVGLSAEMSWFDGRTGIDVDRTGGGTSIFPDLESKRFLLSARADYRWRENADIYAVFGYERLDTDDWALDGIDEDTLSTVLGLGADAYDYDALFAGAGLNWRFDAAKKE